MSPIVVCHFLVARYGLPTLAAHVRQWLRQIDGGIICACMPPYAPNSHLDSRCVDLDAQDRINRQGVRDVSLALPGEAALDGV